MLERLRLAIATVAVLALLAPAAAAADAEIGAESDDAIIVLSGNVVVEPGQTVDGVYVASGDVLIQGHVTSDVFVLSGDVTVTGRIDGDLFIASGATQVLAAEIGGNVIYADRHPEVSTDTVVGGEVKRLDWPDFGDGLPILGGIILWLAASVSFALLGALLILIAPRGADALIARSRERAGPTIAIGIAIAIALPALVVLAAITVVGLPLAIGLALALVPVFCVAYVVAAWALGRRLLGPPRERILAFLVGLAILRAAELVPIVGFLVTIAASVYGLGLIGAAIGAARNPPAARSPGN